MSTDSREVKGHAIKAERDRRMQTGGVLVNGRWYQTDQFSRTQHIQLTLISTGLPKALQWRTLDGSMVTMTADIAATLVHASLRNDAAIFDAAEKHLAALSACDTPEGYEFSAGWPQAFGE